MFPISSVLIQILLTMESPINVQSLKKAMLGISLLRANVILKTDSIDKANICDLSQLLLKSPQKALAHSSQ